MRGPPRAGRGDGRALPPGRVPGGTGYGKGEGSVAGESDRLVEALLTTRDPFAAASRRCFGCGADNARGLRLQVESDAGRGEASCAVTLDADLQGWEGVAHGGVVSTLLDEVLTYSLGERRPVFTVELRVRYKKAVPLGVPLAVRARRTASHGRLMQAEGEVIGPGGEVLATAEGKFLRPRGH